jgi:pimeloyl-ACP methyl ester carboxylesterase
LGKLQISGKVAPSVAMERLRTKLYSPGGARSVPNLIDRLATGDISVLSSGSERAGFNYFDGVYLTITCSESLPWFDETQARKDAQGTLFGDYRLTRQREACANWPRAHVKDDFFEPVRARVPVLFLSGSRDPVTPGNWAEEAARGLPNSRHITITWAGHIVDGLTGLDSCFDAQVVRFLGTADPMSVDDRCFASMMPPPFKI